MDDHETIRDPLAHYLGCLKISERAAFLSKLEREKGPGEGEKIKKELRRLQFILDALSRDELDRDLVERVKESGKAWAS